MGQFDATIEWLQRQHKNAVKAVHELRSGNKIEVEGADVTEAWISRYERLIRRYERLIEKYEQRNRESSLSQSVMFRE
jgi:hypothetical protein